MNPVSENINFHGIEAIRLNDGAGSEVIVSLFGAQVLSWKTADGKERLFLSERAVFDGQRPIRGGIPVCFPQFAGQGGLPKHGLLRTREWRAAQARHGEGYSVLCLETSDDAATRAIWPHAFHAELTVMLARGRLDVEFCATNTGDRPFAFTGALHTYLRVVQVEDVTLEGLHGFEYIDSAANGRRVRETGTALMPEGEIDRIYCGVNRPLLLSAGNLSAGIDSEGFSDIVVWNPWVERCAQLADMPPEAWRHMLCVESAVAESEQEIAPGETWWGRQTLVAL